MDSVFLEAKKSRICIVFDSGAHVRRKTCSDAGPKH